jgi:hypothetical protein
MKALRLLLPLLAALFIHGCSEKTKTPTTSVPDPPTESVPTNLEADMSAKLDELSSTVSLDITNPPPEFDTNFDYYAVVFVWGTLHRGDVHIAGGDIIDWSGTLTFNGVGDINPVHPISFEPWSDTLKTDTFPGFVEWASSTLVEFDGISAVVSHDRRVVYVTAPRLQFSTTPFSIELQLDQLEKYFGIFPVDNMNAVAVMARRIRRNVCVHGGLSGSWVREDVSGFKGTMNGLWFNALGDSVGRYAGQYWVSDSGHYRFEGSISGLDTDEIKGHFRGRWWFDDYRMCPAPECGTGHGRFVGRLAYPDSSNVGVIIGEFGDWTGNTTAPMHGRWKLFCPGSTYELPADM